MVIFGYPYSSTIMEWRLRRVVPGAAVTSHAKPHAQRQLARDVEVARAAWAALSTSKLRAWSPVCGSTLRIYRAQE